MPRRPSASRWLRRWIEHWLPEDVDARPWGERCGYECTGRAFTQTVFTCGPDVLARARAGDPAAMAIADASLRDVPRDAAQDDRRDVFLAWGSVPPELIAVAIRRSPADVRAIARDQDLVELGRSVTRVTDDVPIDAQGHTAHRWTIAEPWQGAFVAIGFPRDGATVRELSDVLGVPRAFVRARIGPLKSRMPVSKATAHLTWWIDERGLPRRLEIARSEEHREPHTNDAAILGPSDVWKVTLDAIRCGLARVPAPIRPAIEGAARRCSCGARAGLGGECPACRGRRLARERQRRRRRKSTASR